MCAHYIPQKYQTNFAGQPICFQKPTIYRRPIENTIFQPLKDSSVRSNTAFHWITRTKNKTTKNKQQWPKQFQFGGLIHERKCCLDFRHTHLFQTKRRIFHLRWWVDRSVGICVFVIFFSSSIPCLCASMLHFFPLPLFSPSQFSTGQNVFLFINQWKKKLKRKSGIFLLLMRWICCTYNITYIYCTQLNCNFTSITLTTFEPSERIL